MNILRLLLCLTGISVIGFGQEGRWDSFVQRIQQEKSVKVKFEQVFEDRESGMDIEETGTLVAVYGEGIAVEYEDGRCYVLKRDGVWMDEGDGEPQWREWDENVRENPLLRLVGLSERSKEPVEVDKEHVSFGPRPGLWKDVNVRWKSRDRVFPTQIEMVDEEDNRNRFSFSHVNWKLSSKHPLVQKVVG